MVQKDVFDVTGHKSKEILIKLIKKYIAYSIWFRYDIIDVKMIYRDAYDVTFLMNTSMVCLWKWLHRYNPVIFLHKFLYS